MKLSFLVLFSAPALLLAACAHQPSSPQSAKAEAQAKGDAYQDCVITESARLRSKPLSPAVVANEALENCRPRGEDAKEALARYLRLTTNATESQAHRTATMALAQTEQGMRFQIAVSIIESRKPSSAAATDQATP